MDPLHKLTNAAHATLHELGSKLGVRDGWCLEDQTISPPRRYPLPPGSWGYLSNVISTFSDCAKIPGGFPLVVVQKERAGENYTLSIYSKGEPDIRYSLTAQEVSELHEIIDRQIEQFGPEYPLDAKAMLLELKAEK